jgi:hypothetical protein
MASPQEFPLAPPLPHDRETLQDFAEVAQRNLRDLFELSHEHTIRTTEPLASELQAGVPVVVNLSGTYYLYVRVSDTQVARVALTVV